MIPGSYPPSNNEAGAEEPASVGHEATGSHIFKWKFPAGYFRSNLIQNAAALAAALLLFCLIGTPFRPAAPLFSSNPTVVSNPNSYVYPVMAPRMSSGYGMRIHPIRRFSTQHTGIDLAAPIGSPIRAISEGVVVFADPYAGYGNFVVIQHKRSVTSHYGHCHELKVRTGQKVRAGEIIAYVGSTGMSTGPHLHFEIRTNGTPIDPEKLIPGLADAAEG